MNMGKKIYLRQGGTTEKTIREKTAITRVKRKTVKIKRKLITLGVSVLVGVTGRIVKHRLKIKKHVNEFIEYYRTQD